MKPNRFNDDIKLLYAVLCALRLQSFLNRTGNYDCFIPIFCNVITKTTKFACIIIIFKNSNFRNTRITIYYFFPYI